MGLFTLPIPTGWRAHPSSPLVLDSRSPNLLATPQPFPATSEDLLVAMGSPGGWSTSQVLGIYLCDTVSPLVSSSFGFGPDLIANAAGELTLRECCGLPDTTFASKLGVEVLANTFGGFEDAGVSFMNVDAGAKSFLTVLRLCSAPHTAAYRSFLGKHADAESGGTGWTLEGDGSNLRLSVYGAVGSGSSGGALDMTDCGWICVAGYVYHTAHTMELFTSRGDFAAGAYVGSAYNTAHFGIGSVDRSQCCQIAYVACLSGLITSAMRVAFWQSILGDSDVWGTDNTYTRANQLIAPITANRVACYAPNQPATSYSPNASVGDNALRTSVICEDAVTFEAQGSDSIYANIAIFGGAAVALVDGASGMRDGLSVTMGNNWSLSFALLPAGACAIAGASNVPWRLDANYKQPAAPVGTTARMGMWFTGSGMGAEIFTLLSDAATPADWTRNGGTCTPANADQTAQYAIFGAALNADNCDFAEPAVVMNRATTPLAWRRVSIAAAAATGTPSLSYNNAANAVYEPARGRLTLRLSDFAVTNGSTFLGFGLPAANGALVLDYSADALRLRIYDNAGALVGTAAGGALAAATEYTLTVEWDAAVGKFAVFNGATVLCSYVGTWTPPVAGPATVYVGCDAAGANAARCHCVLLDVYSY